MMPQCRAAALRRPTSRALQVGEAVLEVRKNSQMFQVVLCELDRDGNVVAHWPVQPLYELREDAVAIAEFDALRLSTHGNYDAYDDCVQVVDRAGKMLRIEVRQVSTADTAT